MGLDNFWTNEEWVESELVCPSDDCGYTETVDGEVEEQRHCEMCGSFLPIPQAVMNSPAPEEGISLVGGMFSGHGAGSFRGKVYLMTIEAATGVSIRQHRIEPETVKMMADDLETTEWDDIKNAPRGPSDEDEWDDLVTMFRFYADRDAALEGWW